jgi:tRNA nucleotidyltransferase (CCA-adding enzyme)
MLDDAKQIAKAVQSAGGRALIVGGFVRDRLMGKVSKDVDFEVYGLPLAKVVDVLSAFGTVNAVGKAFGVLKVAVNGHEFDVSLPRRDSKVGAGHKGFVVETDANMTPEEACSRRDFTMNAMAWDCLTGELVDPFGGKADIEAHVLRHIGPTFVEDPLRVLRGAQFAARFEMTMAAETVALCAGLVDEYAALPIERVWVEFEKLLTKGTKPSCGLDVLHQTGWIRHFPELAALVTTPQSPVHHPEGTAYQHTCLAVDCAAGSSLPVVAAVLCHDMGKPSTTDPKTFAAHGHAQAGVAIAEAFLKRIGAPRRLIEKVCTLVADHMIDERLLTDKAVRRLARRLDPATIDELAEVIQADRDGRGFAVTEGRKDEGPATLRAHARRLEVSDGRPVPVVLGRHLLAAGCPPGKEMGRLLAFLYERQLDGAFTTVEEALALLEDTYSAS